jgi:hypothetical protein
MQDYHNYLPNHVSIGGRLFIVFERTISSWTATVRIAFALSDFY